MQKQKNASLQRIGAFIVTAMCGWVWDARARVVGGVAAAVRIHSVGSVGWWRYSRKTLIRIKS